MKDGTGWIEVVNFDSYLPEMMMHLGASTKHGRTITAGQHGEGFALAMLVFAANGYSCEAFSSGHVLEVWFRPPDYR